ncbi:MAG: iron-containing alcohol dehydrogenase [Bifidobacteriaceae bacterium]|nr:iron-containing alcohol dehydrogenase [Bifidobacteriaceae bacterium]
MVIKKNPVLVFDKNLADTAALGDFLSTMQVGTVPIPMEPSCTVEMVESLRSRIGRFHSVIAVGGGAVLDAVKLATIPDWNSLKTGLGIGRSGLVILHGENALEKMIRPIKAVPTTVGTGAEVSGVALVKRSDGRRRLVMGRVLKPGYLYFPKFYQTLPDALLREGAVEVALRVVGEYVSSRGAQVTDEFAIGMLQELRSAMRSCNGDRQACCIRVARVSAKSHSESATRGRNPFTWPLWYIANELSSECDCRKMEASIPLINPILRFAREKGMPWGVPERINQLELHIGPLEQYFAELLLSRMDTWKKNRWSMNVINRTARRTMLAWGGPGMPLAGVDVEELRRLLIEMN